jgi:hypothetical protein
MAVARMERGDIRGRRSRISLTLNAGYETIPHGLLSFTLAPLNLSTLFTAD